MGSITIRHFDDVTKHHLRLRAAEHGHSMEEEARIILRHALATHAVSGDEMVQRIRARFAGLGDIDLPKVEREPVRQPPDMDHR